VFLVMLTVRHLKQKNQEALDVRACVCLYVCIYLCMYICMNVLVRMHVQWTRGLWRGSAAAEIAGSNPAGSMDVRLLSVLCVVR
jgi:hypothetical protein